MAKVITFSKRFPAYHPQAGDPTYFVEKFWNSQTVFALGETFYYPMEEDLKELNSGLPLVTLWDFKQTLDRLRIKYGPKFHTIRAGNRWKSGEFFSPRVWSGTPYKSPMITIAPDIKIEHVWDFEIKQAGFFVDGIELAHADVKLLAKNDGLTTLELYNWFKYPTNFKGQIICWNKDLYYPCVI